METRRRTKAGMLMVAAAAVALLAAAALAACGSAAPGATSSPSSTTIKWPAKSGTVVNAVVGESITVYLKANATTGYSWAVTPGDTMTIVSSKYVPDPNPSGLAGSGGAQVVTIKVTKAGTSDLTGTYRQQWNSPSPGTQPDLTLTVTAP
jgi:predicted secreted protein